LAHQNLAEGLKATQPDFSTVSASLIPTPNLAERYEQTMYNAKHAGFISTLSAPVPVEAGIDHLAPLFQDHAKRFLHQRGREPTPGSFWQIMYALGQSPQLVLKEADGPYKYQHYTINQWGAVAPRPDGSNELLSW